MNHLRTTLLLGLAASLALVVPASGAAKKSNKRKRKPAPTRPFDGYEAPKFIRLDGKPGVNPPANANGNFLIGPDYLPPAEAKVVAVVPQGKMHQFGINSKDCQRFNPGIAREVFGKVDPNNPKTLIVDTHEVDYTRTITVYIPAQYKSGTEVPFIVKHDGSRMGRPDMNLARIMDNLIAQKRIPVQIGILIQKIGRASCRERV